MQQILIDQYTREELENIVRNSYCLKDVVKKIGYSTAGGNNFKTVKKRIQKFNIDTSHFTYHKPIVRNVDNIFCEHSTASQAVLRRWQKKYDFTPYVCSICGQKPEWNGKPLTLILDHINGCNTDDRVENLRWVCPNCNQQLETTGFHGQDKKKLVKQYYCSCGEKVSKKGNSCHKCVSEAKKKIPTTISRDELKQLIRTTSFIAIGDMYNVSDNGVRKWCKAYGLPYRSKDIKKISQEDWEKL